MADSKTDVKPTQPVAAEVDNNNNAQENEKEKKEKLTGAALQKALVEAVEHLFSRENIATDSFLVSPSL